ncbi:hypothetical protein O59_003915 [Cellvibrio sp. BR]|nr:hypothetical protein O59_003915 [Cellvibrio sp. BR]
MVNFFVVRHMSFGYFGRLHNRCAIVTGYGVGNSIFAVTPT